MNKRAIEALRERALDGDYDILLSRGDVVRLCDLALGAEKMREKYLREGYEIATENAWISHAPIIDWGSADKALDKKIKESP